MRTAGLSVQTEKIVREFVSDIIRSEGVKRGIHSAAKALGVSERWVKALHYGEPARISADTYLRAHQARMQLLMQRRAELQRELASIEAHLDERDMATGRAGGLCADETVCAHG